MDAETLEAGPIQVVILAACRVKLEDRLATVTGAREGADSAAVARELDCEHALDHLDKALQVRIAVETLPLICRCLRRGESSHGQFWVLCTLSQTVHLHMRVVSSISVGLAPLYVP